MKKINHGRMGLSGRKYVCPRAPITIESQRAWESNRRLIFDIGDWRFDIYNFDFSLSRYLGISVSRPVFYYLIHDGEDVGDGFGTKEGDAGLFEVKESLEDR